MASPVDVLLGKRGKPPDAPTDPEPEISSPSDLRHSTDPTFLRSPRSVSRCAGFIGGELGSSTPRVDAADLEGEQELAEIMHGCGYRGQLPQSPSRQDVSAVVGCIRIAHGRQ